MQGGPSWIASLFALFGDAASSAASFPSSEDCLILDVFSPSNATGKALPVLLWIHGGGYILGNAANAGGPNFVSSSNGSMIFVSIQYRLGAYGFLSSDDVAKDGSPNAALLDQRAAIDWVHRHIHAFGGDSNKVREVAWSIAGLAVADSLQITIWGGSAGGGSVTAQLILNGGEDDPPFRAAIPGKWSSSNTWSANSLTVPLLDRVSLVAVLQKPEHFEHSVHRLTGGFKLLGSHMSSRAALRRFSQCLVVDISDGLRRW